MNDPKKTETDETAKKAANTESEPATTEGELSDEDLDGVAGGITAVIGPAPTPSG